MPRRARSIQGGLVYHVLNRANARLTLFEKDQDYAAFERVLDEAHAREPLAGDRVESRTGAVALGFLQ